MSQKRVYNAIATFGQLSVGLQALSCIVFAVILLITGGIFLGAKYDLVPAIVDDITFDNNDTPRGAIAVSYRYNGKLYMGTFETMRATRYSVGDDIFIRVNPSHPSTISEDLPWRSLGLGMMAGAMALGYLSWYAIHLVSDDKNMAALAGSLSLFRVLV